MGLVGLGMQTYLSVRHLQSAEFFAKRAERLEARVLRNPNDGLTLGLQSYVTASLFISTAFLDALCDELLSDAAMENGGHLSNLGSDMRNRIAVLGKPKNGKGPKVMANFDQILEAVGAAKLGFEFGVAKEICLAINLRNRFAHYKADWLDVGTDDLVRPKNFMRSSFRIEMQERFPRLSTAGFLGADVLLKCDCAKWALCSAIAYADEVFSRLSVKPIYNHVRPNLV